jgi:uncharacterized protein
VTSSSARRRGRAQLSRREVLRGLLAGAGLWLAAPLVSAADAAAGGGTLTEALRAGLEPPDEHGVRLPRGFSARVVGRSGEPPLPLIKYHWHSSPDGGACFATDDGGWIYVSNSEMPGGFGGVGAMRFDARGTLVDAYPILTDTSINCAGGATPWGTWLSCEEFPEGQVWECDPFGAAKAIAHPAMGRFKHEAAAVDPIGGRVYMTEDTPDGRLYRFTPAPAHDQRLDLSAGVLEVAEIVDQKSLRVRWHAVSDPNGKPKPTARQVRESTAFPGSEGMTYSGGRIYFVTKLDCRVWAYDPATEQLSVIYDDDRFADPALTGLDNIVVAPAGEVVVAEDGGDMQLVAITPSGDVYPLLQVVGQIGSELAGPAFNPAGNRLYFSSQRGNYGLLTGGITYEVTGPFAG